jgi:hypothetical protein
MPPRVTRSQTGADVNTDVAALGRSRSTKFATTPTARNYFVFASSVSRLQRVAFYLAANSLLPPNAFAESVAEPRVIADPLHPAFGQFGLFAKARIPAATVLMCYSGFVQGHGSFPCSQAYTMGYGGEHSDLEIDSEFVGNLARFANDPRGCPNNPSANLVAASRQNRLGENFSAITTKRVILPGEELLLSYGARHRLSGHHWVTRGGRRLSRPRVMPPLSGPSLATDVGNRQLLWQCAQCGTWTQRIDAVLVVSVCGKCGAPRAAHAPLVAVEPGAVEIRPAAAIAGIGLKRARSPIASGTAGHVAEEAPHSKAGHPRGAQARTEADEAVVPPTNVPMDHVATVLHPAIAAQLMSGGGGLAGTLPPLSLPSPWPLDFPYVTWQLWDPEVPHATIHQFGNFHHQSSLSLRGSGGASANRESAAVGPSTRGAIVVTAAAFAAGSEVAVVGGVLVLEGDASIAAAPVALSIVDALQASIEALLVGDVGGRATVDDLVAVFDNTTSDMVPRLVLLATNETSCCRLSSDPTEATAEARLVRDPLGFLYVSLAACRDLRPDDEVVILRRRPLL